MYRYLMFGRKSFYGRAMPELDLIDHSWWRNGHQGHGEKFGREWDGSEAAATQFGSMFW
jgi:hypothetical protein